MYYSLTKRVIISPSNENRDSVARAKRIGWGKRRRRRRRRKRTSSDTEKYRFVHFFHMVNLLRRRTRPTNRRTAARLRPSHRSPDTAPCSHQDGGGLEGFVLGDPVRGPPGLERSLPLPLTSATVRFDRSGSGSIRVRPFICPQWRYIIRIHWIWGPCVLGWG